MRSWRVALLLFAVMRKVGASDILARISVSI